MDNDIKLKEFFIQDINWKHMKLIFRNLTILCSTNGKSVRFRHVGMIPRELSLEDKEKIDEVYMTEDAIFVEAEAPKLTIKHLEDAGISINELSIEPYNPIARLVWKIFEEPKRKVFRSVEQSNPTARSPWRWRMFKRLSISVILTILLIILWLARTEDVEVNINELSVEQSYPTARLPFE